MPSYIIQHNNVWNIYSTVSDGCYWNSGLTLEELKEWYKEEYGRSGMLELDSRIERALEIGTSSRMDKDLRECISCNRAGPDEAHMSYKKFIDKFLVINPADREPPEQE